MDDKLHSICFLKEEEKIPDSILIKCSYCEKEVWLELGEVDKVPTCIACATDLISENKIRISTQFNKKDLKMLFQFLLEKRRTEVVGSMNKHKAKEIRDLTQGGVKYVAVVFEDGSYWIPKSKELAIIVSKIGHNDDEKYPNGMGHRMMKDFLNESFGLSPEEVNDLFNRKYKGRR